MNVLKKIGDLVNDSYYMFFQNMSQINGFMGFVGYSLRELNENETNLYCVQNQLAIPLTQSKLNLTSDFKIRSYTSGCYFYDINTGKWSSRGVDIHKDTNLKQIHCLTSHLTSFAASLVYAPSTINFQYASSNPSFILNPTIYTTIIVFAVAYVFFAIWSRVMDKRVKKMSGVYFLKDNNPSDTYLYELVVFTGNRIESQTSSNVKKFIFFIRALFLVDNFQKINR